MNNPSQDHCAVIFADVSGSTRLYETAGDAVAEAAIGQCLALLKLKTVAAGGRVVKTIGDEIMAVFPAADAAVEAAIEMQAGVAQLPPVAGARIGIRVGLNFGPVVERDGDVFGDAVNVAARLAGQAQRDQIITSLETAEALRPQLKTVCRRLYPVQVKGKEKELEICQVIWQPGEEMTALVAAPPSLAPRKASLRLRYRGRELVLDGDRDTIALGRDAASDLVVEDAKVSRAHCRIDKRQDRFVLADHSSNGTYVSIDGDPETVLRRTELDLRGHGWIAFGLPRAATAVVVEFEVE